MKNIFENKLNKDKNNPFVNKEINGDNEKNMDNTDETIKDSQEDIKEENNKAEEPETEKQTSDENTSDETEALKEKYNTLNNQYLRLAADFDNYRKRQAQEREAL